jgi:hypothetical protein
MLVNRNRLRDLRSGEVFYFDVGGIIDDVVVKLKSVRGARGKLASPSDVCIFLLQHDRRRHHSSLSHFDAACVSALPFVFF